MASSIATMRSPDAVAGCRPGHEVEPRESGQAVDLLVDVADGAPTGIVTEQELQQVPGLLPHDASEQLAQYRMVLDGGQPGVPGVRRPFVDGAEGHVYGEEVGTHDVRGDRLADRRQPVAPAQPGTQGTDVRLGGGY